MIVMKEMEAIFGESSNIDSWMQLVRKVSWNFPGLETEENLEEHKQTVLKFMNKLQATWAISLIEMERDGDYGS